MIALDLGSNTLRGVKLDCKTFERVKEFEKIVKTAEGMHERPIIKKETADRIIKALKEAEKVLNFEKEKIIAVATAALRMAENKKEIIEKIKEETGIEFKIISGEEEARLTALAVEERLKKLNKNEKNFITADLGGGSTEIVIKNRKDLLIKSVNIGIVTFAQKYETVKNIKKNAPKAYEKELKPFLEKLYKDYEKPTVLTATGGTATTITAFLNDMSYGNYDYEKINGKILSVEDISKALHDLLKLDVKEREKWVGTGRGEFIIAGIYLLISLIKTCGFSEIVVIDDSLREGAAIKGCKEEEF